MVTTRNLPQYAEIHRTRAYGRAGHQFRRLVPWVLLRNPASVLDYGAGQNREVASLFSRDLRARHCYDPAIPEIAAIPLERYDMIVCTDVLEHLDGGEIGLVLDHIASLGKEAFFAVDTKPAATILPNGENAHATVRRSDWWLAKIRQHFPEATLVADSRSHARIVTWRASALERLLAWLLYPVLRNAGSRRLIRRFVSRD